MGVWATNLPTIASQARTPLDVNKRSSASLRSRTETHRGLPRKKRDVKHALFPRKESSRFGDPTVDPNNYFWNLVQDWRSTVGKKEEESMPKIILLRRRGVA